MFSQPDDAGDNKPTKTVNYFVKEWVTMGNNVVVFHCSSKFPLVYYYAPKFITQKIVGKTSNIIPPIQSRKSLDRTENGARVFRVPMMKLMPGQAYSEKIMNKYCQQVISKLDEMQFVPDLVVGHFANPSAGLVSRLAKYYSAKSSIVFHGDCNERTIYRYELEKYVKDIGAIGTRSYIESDNVKRLLNLNTNPFVCCSGVPDEIVRKANRICDKHRNNDALNFLYVGSLISRKHVDSVLLAFDAICQKSGEKYSLNIIGGGNEESNLKELRNSLKSREKINFTGRISREEVFEYMKNADIFTLISEEEVYGMVYIEAMLQGCLVIASRGGGFDGIIKHGINGFLCEPGDNMMLTDIYESIMNMSVDEKNKIGQAAIDTAVNYSERAVAERYLKDIMDNQKSNEEIN